MPNNCKCCVSPHRSFIDQQLADRVPYRVICEELGRRGETFSQNNISAHRRNHWQPPASDLDDAIEWLKRRARQEMETAPTPALAGGWLIVLHSLDSLKGAKHSPETMIKALSMMQRIGGISNEQANLMAYMNARQWDNSPALRVVNDDD